MAYQYEWIDGQRVEVNVAKAFKNLRAAFKARWGLDLKITSGTRTRAEQQELYNGWINRKPGYNLAAPPGRSNHEESGPRGPRALDLRDTGADAGVTVIGSARSNWLVTEAKKHGFHNAGHYFSPREGWHYEFTGAIGGNAGPVVSQDTKNRQGWLNEARGEKLAVDGIQGPATTAAIKRYQDFLNKRYGTKLAVDGIWGPETQKVHQRYWDELKKPAPSKPASTPKPGNMLRWKWTGIQEMLKGTGRYKGAIDNKPGSGTISAFQDFINDFGYRKIAVDGKWGPETVKGAQSWLKARWGYSGAIDGLPGSGTKAAWDRAEKENAAAF